MNKILKPVIMVVSAVVLGSFLSACGLGEDQVRVLVQDENGNPVEGATVYQDITGGTREQKQKILEFNKFMEKKYGKTIRWCVGNGWKELCDAIEATVVKTDKYGYAVTNLMTSFDEFKFITHGMKIIALKEVANNHNQCLIGSNNNVDITDKKDYKIVLELDKDSKCHFPK